MDGELWMIAPLVAGALVGAGGSLLSGIFGGESEKAAAKDQRQWEQHMYQNRYRMAVKDLKRAGLNPILAAGSLGGGGVPSGAAADMSDVGAGIRGAASSAMDYMIKKAEIATMESQVNKNQADAASAAAMAERYEKENDILFGPDQALTIKAVGPEGQTRKDWGTTEQPGGLAVRRMLAEIERNESGALEARENAGLRRALTDNQSWEAKRLQAEIAQIKNRTENENLDALTKALIDVTGTAVGTARDIAEIILRRQGKGGYGPRMPRR